MGQLHSDAVAKEVIAVAAPRCILGIPAGASSQWLERRAEAEQSLSVGALLGHCSDARSGAKLAEQVINVAS